MDKQSPHFLDLQEGIFWKISTYLSLIEVNIWSQLNKKFHKMCQKPEFWTYKLINEFPKIPIININDLRDEYKRIYISDLQLKIETKYELRTNPELKKLREENIAMEKAMQRNRQLIQVLEKNCKEQEISDKYLISIVDKQIHLNFCPKYYCLRMLNVQLFKNEFLEHKSVDNIVQTIKNYTFGNNTYILRHGNLFGIEKLAKNSKPIFYIYIRIKPEDSRKLQVCWDHKIPKDLYEDLRNMNIPAQEIRQLYNLPTNVDTQQGDTF